MERNCKRRAWRDSNVGSVERWRRGLSGVGRFGQGLWRSQGRGRGGLHLQGRSSSRLNALQQGAGAWAGVRQGLLFDQAKHRPSALANPRRPSQPHLGEDQQRTEEQQPCGAHIPGLTASNLCERANRAQQQQSGVIYPNPDACGALVLHGETGIPWARPARAVRWAPHVQSIIHPDHGMVVHEPGGLYSTRQSGRVIGGGGGRDRRRRMTADRHGRGGTSPEQACCDIARTPGGSQPGTRSRQQVACAAARHEKGRRQAGTVRTAGGRHALPACCPVHGARPPAPR